MSDFETWWNDEPGMCPEMDGEYAAKQAWDQQQAEIERLNNEVMYFKRWAQKLRKALYGNGVES